MLRKDTRKHQKDYKKGFTINDPESICNFAAIGPKENIQNCIDFLKNNNIKIQETKEIDENIIQIKFSAWKLTVNCIKSFPELKFAGIYEIYSKHQGEAYCIYSESGYSFITDRKFIGYFDSANDERWTQIQDVLEDGEYELYYINTGISSSDYYIFPFKTLWANNNFKL